MCARMSSKARTDMTDLKLLINPSTGGARSLSAVFHCVLCTIMPVVIRRGSSAGYRNAALGKWSPSVSSSTVASIIHTVGCWI